MSNSAQEAARLVHLQATRWGTQVPGVSAWGCEDVRHMKHSMIRYEIHWNTYEHAIMPTISCRTGRLGCATIFGGCFPSYGGQRGEKSWRCIACIRGVSSVSHVSRCAYHTSYHICKAYTTIQDHLPPGRVSGVLVSPHGLKYLQRVNMLALLQHLVPLAKMVHGLRASLHIAYLFWFAGR